MEPTVIAKMPTRVRMLNTVNEYETPNRNQRLNLTMMPAAPRRNKAPCAKRGIARTAPACAQREGVAGTS